MRRSSGFYSECHGLHWVDESDDTVEDMSEVDAPDEAYLDSNENEPCEHSDELDHGVCIDCGETVEMTYNEEPETNPDR